MKLKNSSLNVLLEQLQIPVAYHYHKSKTQLPYLVFFQNGSENLGADDKVYSKDNHYRIELYTEAKDGILEEKLENLLDDAEIYWEKSEDIRIEEENLTMIVYSI